MKRSLYVLFAILLVDQLDAGMMMPILPQLLTDAESEVLLIDPARTEGLGALLVALLGAAYALPAFFAQPLLGQLADRHGRKPLLIASFASSAASFFPFAWGATSGSVALLIVARVVDGIAAGNLLVAQAAVGDVTDEDSRTRYFGYFTASLSLGFVIGPLAGGYLGDPELASWTGPAAAFLVAGGLNVAALAGFALLFRETLADEERDGDDDDFTLARGFHNAREAFADGKRRPYYLILLCYIGGYTFFTTFYAVVLEERLDMDATDSGYFFSALGLALMLVQLFVVDRVERWAGSRKTLWLALFGVAAAMATLALARAPWLAYAAIVPFALGAGLVDPLIMSLLSRSASGREQGRIQGVRGSVDSLGRAVPPFLAGPLAAAGAANWAVLAGAGAMALGGALSLRLLAGDPERDDDGEDGEDGDAEAVPRRITHAGPEVGAPDGQADAVAT